MTDYELDQKLVRDACDGALVIDNGRYVLAPEQLRRFADLVVADLRAENDTLRGLLGNSGKPCAHCGLPVERWGECAHGFPGCARADDAQLLDLFAARQEAAMLTKQLDKAGARYCEGEDDH